MDGSCWLPMYHHFICIAGTVEIQQPSVTHKGVESGQIRLLIPPQTLPEVELGAVYYNVSCYQAADSQLSQQHVCEDAILSVSTTEYVIKGLNVTQRIVAKVTVIRNFNGEAHVEDVIATEIFCAGI